MVIVDRWKKMRDNRVAAVDDTSEQNVQRWMGQWVLERGSSGEIVIETLVRYESKVLSKVNGFIR